MERERDELIDRLGMRPMPGTEPPLVPIREAIADIREQWSTQRATIAARLGVDPEQLDRVLLPETTSSMEQVRGAVADLRRIDAWLTRLTAVLDEHRALARPDDVGTQPLVAIPHNLYPQREAVLDFKAADYRRQGLSREREDLAARLEIADPMALVPNDPQLTALRSAAERDWVALAEDMRVDPAVLPTIPLTIFGDPAELRADDPLRPLAERFWKANEQRAQILERAADVLRLGRVVAEHQQAAQVLDDEVARRFHDEMWTAPGTWVTDHVKYEQAADGRPGTLHIVAMAGMHRRALLHLVATKTAEYPELARALDPTSPFEIFHVAVAPDSDGKTSYHAHTTRVEPEREPEPVEIGATLLHTYLTYRSHGLLSGAPSFKKWLAPIGPITAETTLADLAARLGSSGAKSRPGPTAALVRDTHRDIATVAVEPFGAEEVARRLVGREFTTNSFWRKPLPDRPRGKSVQTVEIGGISLDIWMAPNGQGGFDVAQPRDPSNGTDAVVSRFFDGWHADSEKELTRRIVTALEKGTQDLSAAARPAVELDPGESFEDWEQRFTRELERASAWVPPDSPRHRITALRRRVEGMAQDFQQLGHDDWYATITTHLAQLEQSAEEGTAFPAPPGPDTVALELDSEDFEQSEPTAAAAQEDRRGSDAEHQDAATPLPSVRDLMADPDKLLRLRREVDALRRQLNELSRGRADLSSPAAVYALLGALQRLGEQNKLNPSQARALPLVEEYSVKTALLNDAEQVRGEFRDYQQVAAALRDSLPGAVAQIFDLIDAELRSMTDAERENAATRTDFARLAGWVVDRLAHEAAAQELTRDPNTTPEQRARWQTATAEYDHRLARILGLSEPGTGWTQRLGSDPLHHLRAFGRRADAPRHLVDIATRRLDLHDIAAAVEPLHRVLADWPHPEQTDTAAAIAWELAAQARKDGGGTPEITAAVHEHRGQRWIDVHVADTSRTLPARDGSTSVGWRAVDLLDTHTETWGWKFDRDNGRQVWFKLFETPAVDDPSQPEHEFLLDLPIPQRSLEQGSARVLDAVGECLAQAGHPDPAEPTVLVSDLVRNVFRYADRGDAHVRILRHRSMIRISVTDSGRDLPVLRDPSIARLDADTAAWGLDLARSGGKTIWFETPTPTSTSPDNRPDTVAIELEGPEEFSQEPENTAPGHRGDIVAEQPSAAVREQIAALGVAVLEVDRLAYELAQATKDMAAQRNRSEDELLRRVGLPIPERRAPRPWSLARCETELATLRTAVEEARSALPDQPAGRSPEADQIRRREAEIRQLSEPLERYRRALRTVQAATEELHAPMALAYFAERFADQEGLGIESRLASPHVALERQPHGHVTVVVAASQGRHARALREFVEDHPEFADVYSSRRGVDVRFVELIPKPDGTVHSVALYGRPDDPHDPQLDELHFSEPAVALIEAYMRASDLELLGGVHFPKWLTDLGAEAFYQPDEIRPRGARAGELKIDYVIELGRQLAERERSWYDQSVEQALGALADEPGPLSAREVSRSLATREWTSAATQYPVQPGRRTATWYPEIVVGGLRISVPMAKDATGRWVIAEPRGGRSRGTEHAVAYWFAQLSARSSKALLNKVAKALTTGSTAFATPRTVPIEPTAQDDGWDERFDREIAATETDDTDPPTSPGPDTVAIDLGSDDADAPPGAGAHPLAGLDIDAVESVRAGIDAERIAAIENTRGSSVPGPALHQRLNDALVGIDMLLTALRGSGTAFEPDDAHAMVEHYRAAATWLAALKTAKDAASDAMANSQVPPAPRAQDRAAIERFRFADKRIRDLHAEATPARGGIAATADDWNLLRTLDPDLVQRVRAEVLAECTAATVDPRAVAVDPADRQRLRRRRRMLELVDDLLALSARPDPAVSQQRLRHLVKHFNALREWLPAQAEAAKAIPALLGAVDDSDLIELVHPSVRPQLRQANQAVLALRTADERLRERTAALVTNWRWNHAVERVGAGGYTDRGNQHTSNEDFLAIETATVGGEQWTLAAVTDGVSGQGHSDEASRAAAEAACAVLAQEADRVARGGRPDPVGTVERALRAALEAVVDLVRTQYSESEVPPECTIVLALVTPSQLVTVAVGDAEAYLVRLDGGRSEHLTQDPAVRKMIERYPDLTPAEIAALQKAPRQVEALGRKLADRPLPRPTVHDNLTGEWVVALGSDGAFNVHRTTESVADCVKQQLDQAGGHHTRAAVGVVRYAKDHREGDNISVALVGRPERRSPGGEKHTTTVPGVNATGTGAPTAAHPGVTPWARSAQAANRAPDSQTPGRASASNPTTPWSTPKPGPTSRDSADPVAIDLGGPDESGPSESMPPVGNRAGRLEVPQAEIVKLVRAGKTPAEIAEELGIPPDQIGLLGRRIRRYRTYLNREGSRSETPATYPDADQRSEYEADLLRYLRQTMQVPSSPSNPVAERLERLAREIKEAVLRLADSRRWPVTAGEDVGRWLRAVADEAVRHRFAHEIRTGILDTLRSTGVPESDLDYTLVAEMPLSAFEAGWTTLPRVHSKWLQERFWLGLAADDIRSSRPSHAPSATVAITDRAAIEQLLESVTQAARSSRRRPTTQAERDLLRVTAFDYILVRDLPRTDDERRCYELRFRRGWTIPQIADELGRTQRAIREMEIRLGRSMAAEGLITEPAVAVKAASLRAKHFGTMSGEELLRRAAALPEEEERAYFRLHFLEGWTFQAIATEFGCSQAHVEWLDQHVTLQLRPEDHPAHVTNETRALAMRQRHFGDVEPAVLQARAELLDPVERTFFQLRFLHGRSWNQIAKELSATRPKIIAMEKRVVRQLLEPAPGTDPVAIELGDPDAERSTTSPWHRAERREATRSGHQTRVTDPESDDRPHLVAIAGDNVLAGTVHRSDPSHPQSVLLEDLLRTWERLTRGQERVVFVEGSIPGPDETMAGPRGEMALAAQVARELGIALESLEEGEEEQVAFLLEEHDRTAVFLYYVLRYIPQGLRSRDTDMDAHLEKALDRYWRLFYTSPVSRTEFFRLLALEYPDHPERGVPRRFTKDDEDWLLSETTDMDQGTARTRIRAVGDVCQKRREYKAAEKIDRYLAAGVKIFAPYGEIHFDNMRGRTDTFADSTVVELGAQPLLGNTTADPASKTTPWNSKRQTRPAGPSESATEVPRADSLGIRPTQPNAFLYRVQESELVRYLGNAPKVKAATIAVLDRLETVIRGLCPEATEEQIRAAFDATARPRWGGMVLPSVPLDELKSDGNSREQLSAILNAMTRHSELGDATFGPTLDQGIARYMNRDEDARRRQANELGLDFEALEAVRAAILEDKQPGEPIRWNDLNPVEYVRVRGDKADAAFAEYAQRNAAFPARVNEEPRLAPTSGDFARLGMPLSLREFAALPERKVLSISELDAAVERHHLADGRIDTDRLTALLRERDPRIEYVEPKYSLDVRGRRILDDEGHCVVSSIKVYRDEGFVTPEQAYRLDHSEHVVQLPWRPGFVYVDPDLDNDYTRALAEQGIPANAGISGTATRMLARFRWLRPPGVSEQDFLAAMVSFMLPYHHTTYEFVRGLEMLGVWMGDDIAAMHRSMAYLFGPRGHAAADAGLRREIAQQISSGRRARVAEMLEDSRGVEVLSWVRMRLPGHTAAREITTEICVAAADRWTEIGGRSIDEWLTLVSEDVLAEHVKHTRFRQSFADNRDIRAGAPAGIGDESALGPVSQ
ncbi:protein phosphatase 2C domain-containing protein [Nocardia blacklockiae]|uniref:protein phosphatase 2C domain-containing protein n=1 Tax=Nocardia blacklockiae TaxID=480036 RepID=UPI0018952FCA|nr:protein phosphatase 2C domain-containing protein [Nocardia blacklockiae]MBF6174733.1 protein phosphatase 2C domain-containing protein [Nocardia blacklockiae]